jgi:DNA repair protein RadD
VKALEPIQGFFVLKIMEYELRDYQQESSQAAIEYLTGNSKKNAMIVLPTGSGKSLVIAEIANGLDSHVLIFQPSKEILEQNYNKLLSYDILDCSIYSASFNSKKISRITFATIGSVKNNPELFEHFKYIIIDECHFVNPKKGMYKEFLENVPCKVLGLTATPYRLTTDGFGGSILKFLTRTRPKVFTDLIYHSQISTLLDRGYLSELEYFNIEAVDISQLKVNSTGADFTDESVKNHYKKIEFNTKLINIVERLIKAGRSNIIVFTRFIEEAQYIVDNMAGLAEIVTGKTPKKDRERILNDFKSGEFKVVANVGVLTTGFDFPELSTIVLARPTKSLALYYQMVGRAIRPHEDKKTGWIVDLCQTYKRFGKVEDLKLVAPKPKLWHIESNGKQLTNVYYE